MLEYTCAFQCGPDGEGWKEPGFLVVPACPVHGWMAAALAAERQARQDAERELAEAVERGQNLVDGIGMERDMRCDAEAALADARRALVTIRDLPSRRTLLLNAEARAMWEYACGALASLPEEPPPPSEPRDELPTECVYCNMDRQSVEASLEDCPDRTVYGCLWALIERARAALASLPEEPPPPSEPRENFTRGLGHDSQMPTMGGWPAVPPDTQPPRAKLTFGTTVDSISRASGGGGERNAE